MGVLRYFCKAFCWAFLISSPSIENFPFIPMYVNASLCMGNLFGGILGRNSSKLMGNVFADFITVSIKSILLI